MLIDDYSIKILYEDNHLIFVTKPFGVPSQEDSSKDNDMLTILKEYIKNKYNKPGNVFLGLLHRLDRPAGGVMVFAKTSKAAGRISEQIRNRKIEKSYIAIVKGEILPQEKFLENFLIKDTDKNIVSIVAQNEGKLAQLHYQVIKSNAKFSMLQIKLFTGRYHQIRVQMAHIGYPLYGDLKYGGASHGNSNSICLWSHTLKIKHPITNEDLLITANFPDVFPWNTFDNNIIV